MTPGDSGLRKYLAPELLAAVQSCGRPLKHIARDIGVTPTYLKNWLKRGWVTPTALTDRGVAVLCVLLNYQAGDAYVPAHCDTLCDIAHTAPDTDRDLSPKEIDHRVNAVRTRLRSTRRYQIDPWAQHGPGYEF